MTMNSMTSSEIRKTFLEFFEEHGHSIVASSSLVPANDPTLLFTNSGMVQFKDVFLGLDKRPYTRATTSQKSMRVSGKHNDLENVGPSPRHHTFFEMLGNFSFGDYFKREAIQYAYQLLTQVYQLPADRLVFTVYQNDDDAYNLWVNEVGVDPKRVARMGPKTNFWQMAETGPCGPTSEIHWDKYPEQGEDTIITQLQAEDDRFLEIWNLVFMQFNRTQADPQHTGQFDELLPAPGVDTGMGLERIVSIIQGVKANYETDLFMPIIRATQALTGQSDQERDANIVPYRVIADHIRAAVFLIADGVRPGAKGRDSVCRLVIRRAARFGQKIGFDRPFLGQVAQAVIETMGEHYQEITERADAIQRVITREEELFRRTLDRGVSELNEMLDHLSSGQMLPGERAFYLKATLGLPLEVTKDISQERGVEVDEAGFLAADTRHSEVSGGGKAMGKIEISELYNRLLAELSGKLGEKGVDYQPYGPPTLKTQVLALIADGESVDRVMTGDRVEVILAATPFYVESGGQVSDTGLISGGGWQIQIEEMRKPIGGLIVHVGEVVEGTPQVSDPVLAEVDTTRRSDITRNHTATHLLHAALRNHLGTHVQQKGSLVAPERLRFDFAHDAKVSAAELKAIEYEVNGQILQNYPVFAAEKSLNEARSEGAMALFGEKYGDHVRTITIGRDDQRYSYELCGGVHVQETGEIGTFVIINEGSVSAGVRRLEALTGRAAMDYLQNVMDQLYGIADRLNTTPENVYGRVIALQEELAQTKRQLTQIRRDLAKVSFEAAMTRLENINGVTALIAQFDDVPTDTLREISDWFRNRMPSGIAVLATVVDEKPQLWIAVSDDLTKKGLHAGNLIKAMSAVVGGGGGGRPNLAQAGGKDATKLPQAFDTVRRLISESHKA